MVGPEVIPKPRELREQLGLSRERMARLLDVSAKTVERWEEGNGGPLRSAVASRLAKIREIVDLGLAVYEPEELSRFLQTPMRVFDGYTALQLIELGRTDSVLAVLAADYEGVSY